MNRAGRWARNLKCPLHSSHALKILDCDAWVLRYWPSADQQVLDLDGLTVEVVHIGPNSDHGYELQKLLIKCGAESHTVWHYWFTKWPDHGVPTDDTGNFETQGLVTMVRDIKRRR